ncbi:hypothetical protein [Spartinivicinus poritis]|uniref:Phage tail protein n=1 Tax=Spartinivicinus poritis TaxID=2994640 RepID=A0ABT5UAM2_9GAMM|nr:hypothetical protein [Spartinivicinus sp. A2-2]MDE1463352.1 hypothetical protein [Spartinivicinus sp. A2-2]
MALEQDISRLVEASNRLTTIVDEKIKGIDSKLNDTIQKLNGWKASAEAKDINGEPRYEEIIDLTHLDTDKFYPVWWRFPGNTKPNGNVTISRNYTRDQKLDPFKDGGKPHVAGLLCQLEGNAYPWSGDANYLTIKRLRQTYRHTIRKVSFGFNCFISNVDGTYPIYSGHEKDQFVESRVFSGCYLRGGLSYIFTHNGVNSLDYLKANEERTIYTHFSAENKWEISYYVKPLLKTDSLLGEDYPLNGQDSATAIPYQLS